MLSKEGISHPRNRRTFLLNSFIQLGSFIQAYNLSSEVSYGRRSSVGHYINQLVLSSHGLLNYLLAGSLFRRVPHWSILCPPVGVWLIYSSPGGCFFPSCLDLSVIEQTAVSASPRDHVLCPFIVASDDAGDDIPVVQTRDDETSAAAEAPLFLA